MSDLLHPDLHDEAIAMVRRERLRQEQKWGYQRLRRPSWLLVLMEEVGEASEAVLKSEADGFLDEVVQAAAVAVAIIEQEIERRRG